VALAVTSTEQQTIAARARRLLAVYERARDLIEVGAYSPGGDVELDRAVALAPLLEDFRRQGLHDLSPADESWERLAAILASGEEISGAQPGTEMRAQS
jgi:flagellum-specific ATP synthase